MGEEFLVSAEGIITAPDGLEWYVGPDEDTTWDTADAWVKDLKVDGGGWRLPTIEELRSLYKGGVGTRNMPPIFKTTGWWVWSIAQVSSSAWLFYFANNHVGWDDRSSAYSHRVFAVRRRKLGAQSPKTPLENVIEALMGKRKVGEIPQWVEAIDQPAEIGYHCPVCEYEAERHGKYGWGGPPYVEWDERLHWSEYEGFLWCSVCNKDYPSCLCMPDPIQATEIFLDTILARDARREKTGCKV